MRLFNRPPNVEKLLQTKDVDGLLKALELDPFSFPLDSPEREIPFNAANALIDLMDEGYLTEGQEQHVIASIVQIHENSRLRGVKLYKILARIATPETLQPMLNEMCVDTNQSWQFTRYQDKRKVIAGILKGVGEPAVKPILKMVNKEALHGTAAESAELIDVLGEIGDRRAVKPLIAILQCETSHKRMRLLSAGALGKFDARDVLDPLIETLSKTKPWSEMRKEIAKTLGHLGDQRAAKPRKLMLESFENNLKSLERDK
jgi:hypothetical protein